MRKWTAAEDEALVEATRRVAVNHGKLGGWARVRALLGLSFEVRDGPDALRMRYQLLRKADLTIPPHGLDNYWRRTPEALGAEAERRRGSSSGAAASGTTAAAQPASGSMPAPTATQ